MVTLFELLFIFGDKSEITNKNWLH